MRLIVLERLSHYQIAAKIGEGGMGAVYRAVDTRLNRTVAIKVLPPDATADSTRKRRFVQEAQSASALNHPNIVSIYDIDSDSGVDFIAMEFAGGETLDRVIARGPVPDDQARAYAIQIASALAAAHESGIIHRDIKPANVMVSRTGHVKVLDFGLAKLVHTESTETFAATRTATPPTASGTVVGTAPYMSPEQAEGRPIDARSDIFSFGALLYEMLTGRRAFQGSSPLSTLAAVLHEQPKPLRTLCPGVAPDLDRIVSRCLEKDPRNRYASAGELKAALEASGAMVAARATRRGFNAPLIVALVIVAAAAIAAVAWFSVRNSRVKWARNVALPQLEQYVTQGQADAAFVLARQIQPIIPDDPQLARLANNSTDPANIRTDPEGADVYTRGYLDLTRDWIYLGKTPLENVRVPFGFRRYRITKDGYEPREIAATLRVPTIALRRQGEGPEGMVLVTRGLRVAFRSPLPLPDFWIDRYEVTNRQFKAFVDAGGYTKREFWKQPFVKDKQEMSWDEAMRLFRDATGRPGPATWELSTYPEGQADLPVTGVSWYEAAAFAEYAGKSLPTVYHWHQAAAQGIYSEVLLLSNFSGKGLAKVGEYQGLGPFGTFDMAGNAKEWCFNATQNKRYILGGAWNEPSYLYTDRDAQSPLSREANYGFRTVKYLEPLDAALTAPVERPMRDYTKERPASDEVYRVYRSLYAYDARPLNPSVEQLARDADSWRVEKITIDAAYGGERIPMFLYLPRNATAPYQTVVFFPGGNAFALRSNAHMETRQFQFLVQSGRAVVYPVYRGTFDRWIETHGARDERDLAIQDAKDCWRVLDYLETRPDIDKTKFAYYGISAGADVGSLVLADQSRIRAAVFLGGGLDVTPTLPEADQFNFAPHVTIPLLMVNGRYDFVDPVETSQRPLFETLGTPPDQKRHVIFESGHAVTAVQPMVKEMLDWLDKYLGPVAPQH